MIDRRAIEDQKARVVSDLISPALIGEFEAEEIVGPADVALGERDTRSSSR